MGDAGEGLVDADTRIQELRDQREAEKKERGRPAVENPQAVLARESLLLARASLAAQVTAATHPARRAQLDAAIADLDRQLGNV